MTPDRAAQQLMQYSIGLPADYDMEIIRARIRTRGSALDERPGLLCKAYCIRDRAVGAPANEYAPFYLWASAPAAASFLWGGTGFDGIVHDFGRPQVLTWLPASTALGDLPRTDVDSALLRTSAIPRDADLVDAVATRVRSLSARTGAPQVHLAALGVDLTRWQTVEFCSGRDLAAEPGTVRYQVLHVSQPG